MHTEPTDLEKKSLEAHVDLCAQRYRFLEEQITHIEKTISDQGEVICKVHDLVQEMSNKRNDQLMSWGMGIIGALVAIVGYLLVTYVVK